VRPTLVCGGAGCGKTLLGMEFVVRGAVTYGGPTLVRKIIGDLSNTEKVLVGLDLRERFEMRFSVFRFPFSET
jgi:hypothetical protein